MNNLGDGNGNLYAIECFLAWDFIHQLLAEYYDTLIYTNRVW
jgi:hypothetical protein